MAIDTGEMMSRWFIVAGCILLVIGVLMHFAPGLFTWFGRLPGDIRFESGRSRVFIPITSMIVISVVLSLLLNLFRR
ncbi:DUF2905 domain-containing protein [Microbulbifer sediminum]|uniref:DUF2905 domain-containing protein n=1 Tax=Microbulbifer sediminum TaxID=2904250 RepID=UPI001F157358|nr:DUF2905 domain-containing protein [Microbulbifer sediminum]